MQKIEITLEDLKKLLDEQKTLVIERLKGNSSSYNSTNTPGCFNSLTIDEPKFKEAGMSARYPEDFNVLKRYLK